MYRTKYRSKQYYNYSINYNNINHMYFLQIGQENGTVLIYIFGMFYCGTITIGNGSILQITGGSDDPIWITWKDDGCIKTTRVSCPLLEKSKAFLKVSYMHI